MTTRIVVAGAGAVGCFVGGLLAAAGRDVVLWGRARIGAELASRGLTCTDFTGFTRQTAPAFSERPAVLADAEIVLVCVKSGATEEIGRAIAEHAPAGVIVVSLQNGVGNANTLRRALPGRDVRAGVVGFNVVAQGNGQFRRSTSGEIYVEAGPGALDKQLSVPGLSVVEASEIEPLQWGKLILNLTNAVNALSGLPLREMLLSRPWRRVLAAQMEEAMAVLRHAGIAFRIPAAAPARAIPAILRLPSWAFRHIAATMLTVDEAARTSMAIDLNAGRQTEIDQLQGEIIRLAVAHGMQAPVNARVAAAVDRAESATGTGTGLAVSPQTLLAGAGSF